MIFMLTACLFEMSTMSLQFLLVLKTTIVTTKAFLSIVVLTSVELLVRTGTLGFRRLSKNDVTSFSESVTFSTFFVPSI